MEHYAHFVYHHLGFQICYQVEYSHVIMHVLVCFSYDWLVWLRVTPFILIILYTALR